MYGGICSAVGGLHGMLDARTYLWLHDERDGLCGAHALDLALGGRDGNVVHGLGQAHHHRLDPELRPTAQHRVKVNAKHPRQLGCAL